MATSAEESSVGKQPYLKNDVLLFPTFIRANSPEGIRRFQPKDTSPLAAEVGLALRTRCSVRESEVFP